MSILFLGRIHKGMKISRLQYLWTSKQADYNISRQADKQTTIFVVKQLCRLQY